MAIEPRVGKLDLMMCRLLFSLAWNLESFYTAFNRLTSAKGQTQEHHHV
jgi:hypothetical protein